MGMGNKESIYQGVGSGLNYVHVLWSKENDTLIQCMKPLNRMVLSIIERLSSFGGKNEHIGWYIGKYHGVPFIGGYTTGSVCVSRDTRGISSLYFRECEMGSWSVYLIIGTCFQAEESESKESLHTAFQVPEICTHHSPYVTYM